MTYPSILMMVLSLLPGPFTSRVFVGFATDMNQGKHLYAEEHEASYENGRPTRLATTYRDELKKIIATRMVDFSQHAFTPTFRLENHRTGYVEGAEKVNGGLRLYVRRATNSPSRRRSFPFPSLPLSTRDSTISYRRTGIRS